MVKLISKTNVDGDKAYHYEFSGLSADNKPMKWEGQNIEDNSLFLELDTQKFYYFAEESWVELGQAPVTLTLLLDKTITDFEEGYPGTGIYIETSTFDVPLPTSLKVIWDGTTYSCTDDGEGYFGAPLDFDNMTADFSTYPFALAIISSNRQTIYVVTDNDSEHTIKIYGEVE